MPVLNMINRDIFERKTFLVTGGAGFIGSHIVEALLLLGGSVVVMDDLSNGRLENLNGLKSDRLRVLDGDVRSFELDNLGILDGIFNEAARALIPSFYDPFTDLAVNAGGTIRLLDYARRKNVKMIHASSGSIYGNPISIPITENHPLNPISPYGASKLCSEVYCLMFNREFGVDVTMLRYFNVYGPRQTVSEEMGVIPIFVKRALEKHQLTIFGDGKQTRDFLNVRDVVNANLLAFCSSKGKGNYMNIGGGGNEISILDLAELVMELCGFRTPVKFDAAKPGDIRRLMADNSRAKDLIEYVPVVSLKEGLAEYIEYFRQKNQSQ